MKEIEKMKCLDPKKTFVSTIDADTAVEKNFLSVVTHTFLSTQERDQASWSLFCSYRRDEYYVLADE